MGTERVREVVGDICYQLPVAGVWSMHFIHFIRFLNWNDTLRRLEARAPEPGVFCIFLCGVAGGFVKKSGARLEYLESRSRRSRWGCILEHTFADTLWMRDGMCSILLLGQHFLRASCDALVFIVCTWRLALQKGCVWQNCPLSDVLKQIRWGNCHSRDHGHLGATFDESRGHILIGRVGRQVKR